ncbi:MAG: DUF4365 domain-containing protein [Capsulimonas sp.]|uniref:DUF4365 domain-containing protein n=1 Tax=Capsulimonas sp. TaxID=2494211 RepID=UPI003265707E
MRPERTRAHYIESISKNFVERFIILKGHVVDKPEADYGYDIVMTTFDFKNDLKFSKGEVENCAIYIQLKATDTLNILVSRPDTISFEITRKHANLWASNPMPVILIVYSVVRNEAYWLHMQPYLHSSKFKWPENENQEKITVYIPLQNIVDEDAIEGFRQSKNEIVARAIKELYSDA